MSPSVLSLSQSMEIPRSTSSRMSFVLYLCGVVLSLGERNTGFSLTFNFSETTLNQKLFRITTFLEFLETSKCQGIRLRLVKSRGKGSKVRERSGNSCSQGNLIAATEQNAGNQTVV